MLLRQALAGLFLALVLAAPAGARLPEPLPEGPPLFHVPLDGPLESGFGPRWGRLHEGIDIGAFAETRVRAARPGVVTRAGWLPRHGGYGLVVKVTHEGGLVTMYAHLARALVRPGDRVFAGQLIGRAGCTGSCTGTHLHFQVWEKGKLVDPLRFLGKRVRPRR